MMPPATAPLLPLRRLLLAAAALLLAATLATGQVQPVPTCPGIHVAAHVFPLQGKAGAPLRVYVSVRNKGRANLKDVGLRVSVPLDVKYKAGAAKVVPAFKWGEGGAEPVFGKPQGYWPRFALAAGQSRLFRLKAQVRKGQPAGAFPIGVAAYRPGLNCSSGPKKSVQVRWIGWTDGWASMYDAGRPPPL